MSNREGLVGGQYAVLAESTWYALLRDFLNYYSREFSEPEELQKLSFQALVLMVEKPHEKAWEKLEGFVLDQIDQLSGWTKSWVREEAERRNVFKGEDGNYYHRVLAAAGMGPLWRDQMGPQRQRSMAADGDTSGR